MLGVTTIGNATLIAYDDEPILTTDPWLGEEDHAYFGSWNLRHFIPSQQKQDILKAKKSLPTELLDLLLVKI